MGIGSESLGISFSACACTGIYTESMRGIKCWVGFGLARGGSGVVGYHAAHILRDNWALLAETNFTNASLS